MPTFDTGHLFLTFLSPVRHGTRPDPFGVQVSVVQNLRTVLRLLPTALQSPATQDIGVNSPFARSLQTHLCRFVVIEDTIYNGRDPKDALVMSLRGQDPIHPQKVDKLNSAYLCFVADVDAVLEEGDPLPATLDAAGQAHRRDLWARRLWDRMEPELRDIYDNCVGFDQVRTGEEFAAYLARCQIDTTMPFNDYWIEPPALRNLPLGALAGAIVPPLAVTLLALFGLLFGADAVPLVSLFADWSPGMTFLLGGALTAAVAYGLIRYVIANGQAPMPPARYGDLPSVLKSLYLQQHFADFAIAAQGQSDAELHQAFGAFLQAHRPDDKTAPTQAPGVISCRAPGGTVG
jgi:hypothetical protein